MFSKNLAAMLLAIALCGGCQRQQPDEHGHGHAHAEGPVPLSYTLYSDRAEVFVEFKPLVVGQQSKFVTHVTVLGERFTALSEGTVTVSLLVGSNGIRNRAESPSVPGIYRLALQPTIAGTGKLIFDIKTKDFSDQLVIDSVTVFQNEQSAIAGQDKEPASSDISFLKEQAWKIDFANQAAALKPVGQVIYTSGQILPAPGDDQTVSATYDGIIQLTGGQLTEGRAIAAGQPVMNISAKQLAQGNLDTELQTATTALQKATQNYEREKQLIDKQLITGREFEAAKAEFDNANARVSALRENYKPGGKSVSSPISGFVKNLLVQSGQYVAKGQPLFTVTRQKSLILKADVSQKDLALLPEIRSASIKLPYNNRIYSLEELGGKILSYGRAGDPQTGFTPILMQVSNVNDLIVGTLVNVWLKTQPRQNNLAVPEAALVEEQGLFYVYVQTAGESFQKREVRLGSRDGQQVEILSGIKVGEHVVTKGVNQIRLSSLSGALPAHGHEH